MVICDGLNKDGVLVARGGLLGHQLFFLAVSNTHPAAHSQGPLQSCRSKVIRGTSAVLLPVNGPLSSGCAGTRAFLNPNIREGREFHQSHLPSGWERRRDGDSASLDGSVQPLLQTLILLWRAGKAGAGGSSVHDVTTAVPDLFCCTDVCTSSQPAPYFCSSEVSSPS